ncbi:DUF6518 family protein [Catellatospora methionotrophica]|nr:DUF6518 family protein [Catellatospora methionotrophica]
MRSIRWMATALAVGVALGTGAALVNNVPIFLGEVHESRENRSGWSQTAEFLSLILDSGWAWAAVAVAAGWLVSKGLRSPASALLVGALGGCIALLGATLVYSILETLFQHVTLGVRTLLFWLVLSVVLGLPLGAVGAAIRRPGWVGALAALVVPLGAALGVVVDAPAAESPAAGVVKLLVWAVAATAAVIVVTCAVRARRSGTGRAGSTV